jgi:lysophospholipase L1-like esterase
MNGTASLLPVNLKIQAVIALLVAGALCGCTTKPPGIPSPRFITSNPTIHLIGDSTMADKPLIPANPERGWGQLLPMYFQDGVRIENHAVNGRSTKSFIDQGRWATITNRLRLGDFVIIQFGHNDEKKTDTNRYTEPFGGFKTNLERFVRETRTHRATPILVTPVARRKFDTNGKPVDTHGDYVTAVRRVAREQDTPLLDLNRDSMELLARLGPESSKRLYDWIPAGEFEPDSKGLSDDTHFNAYGASRMCDLAVWEIEHDVLQLTVWLKPYSTIDIKPTGAEK